MMVLILILPHCCVFFLPLPKIGGCADERSMNQPIKGIVMMEISPSRSSREKISGCDGENTKETEDIRRCARKGLETGRRA